MPLYDFTKLKTIPNEFVWFNDPESFSLTNEGLSIKSKPHTHFWQRTIGYGLKDSGHSLLCNASCDFFTLTTAVSYPNKALYGQCGLIVREDKDNWMCCFTNHANPTTDKISSIVTNRGFSDMSSYECSPTQKLLYYRIVRSCKSFGIEYSQDGDHWMEIRSTDLACAESTIAIGIYTCSPDYECNNDNLGFLATFPFIDIEIESEERTIEIKPMKPFPEPFITRLNEITLRPERYILHSFPELYHLMNGWSYGADDEDFDAALARFEKWIDRRFGFVNQNGHWTHYLDSMLRNPEKPFQEFMKLLIEYQSEAIDFENQNNIK